MNNQRIKQAEAFRNELEYQGGYVIFFAGEIAGWAQYLDRPSAWTPGCIAVDDARNEYRATGGDEQNGALSWEYYFVSHRAKPFVPVSPEFGTEKEAENWFAQYGDESMRLVSAGHL
ncbi:MULTISPECIES: hypothetical protein [Marinobacter]|uniref:hypothetical protein n=1 Tax=Marinobacter TaxID=2742 RepID=UPI002942A144|nr:hypothetical protein [Marinobacter salarius]WOI18121.1 hypothetical protein R1T46_15205 [Marinobacter salarius]